MARPPQRWIEVTRSQFSHEAEGLNLVRSLLPPRDPFRAWSNFEFRDGHGKWHEVDLLVLGQRRLHLVELKYYSGSLRGDDHTWLRDGHRAEDSPLKLARRKAQRLASKLQDELIAWAQETGTKVPDARTVVPFVQESVLLHHPDIRCMLPPASRIDLFGLDNRQRQSGLPGISGRLLEPAAPDQAVTAARSEIVAKLMARIGVVQRRQREAGSWVIDEEPLGEGLGWQDWPAFHRVATTTRARIRFLVTAPGATPTARAAIRRVAEHEYRIMTRLAHDGLVRPTDMVDGDLGVGLVYPLDERLQRLDLWLADQSDGIAVAEQISILRQVAEAVSYAHGNRVVHRGLTPHAVWIRRQADNSLRAAVGDWQSAGAATTVGGINGSSPEPGVTGLLGAQENGSPSTSRPTGLARPLIADSDQRLVEAFQAPEGVWTPSADRIRLDVFALGALAYYVLATRSAASDRASLQDRLRRDNGLDLAADLPQVAPEVRGLVLEATRPKVSERLPDVRAFLSRLADAEKALAAPDEEEVTDPLEAAPGSVIDGRYRLERRLGAGSTAVGLLVTDLAVGTEGPDAVRVLKVAVDDAAAARLEGEAEVLAALRNHRLVRLIEGPVRIGGRTALVLESAGDETVAEVLRGRERLSLDLLERWGTDLLEALVALDRAGVDHRDIKPANLGVREGRSDRAKHLVLFDFSLSRAGAAAVTAGTPPYLDPFLDEKGRGRFDSAAERYSASVVLFEMATGATPRFGDGLSHPATLTEEAAVEPGMFDPAVAQSLTGFFRTALVRSAAGRYDTAADMLAAWQAVFAPVPKTVPDHADQSAARATPSTPLADSGLSARALSALEQFGVRTVADLVAVDPVRLNHMSGVADVTRREVKGRAAQWRREFGASVTGRGEAGQAARGEHTMPDPVAAAALLVERSGSARAISRRQVARLLLGLEPALEPFASQAEISATLGVSRARTAQQISSLQDAWATDEESRDLLDALAGVAARALADLGGVATIGELSGAVLAALPPAPRNSDSSPPARVAAGLLRIALDRGTELGRADEDQSALASRRRDGKIILLASDPALLDPAEAVGKMADHLVESAEAAGEPVIPAQRAIPRLQATWTRAADVPDSDQPPPAPERLLRLAAALAERSALSGSLELHALGLAAATALRLALAGTASAVRLTPQEIRDRLRARFPALASLPDRPRLDELLQDAGLNLRYDEQDRAYRQPSRTGDTTHLSSRPVTAYAEPRPQLVSGGPLNHRLTESASGRSFLALGIEARKLDRAVAVLTGDYGAIRLDVTQTLIDAMRRQAATAGLPWETVRAADAAPAGSRDATGLAVLVQRSLPAVDAAIDAACAGAPEGSQPVLLTEIGPLARYGQLAILAPRADLATRRTQAIWVVIPQLPGNQGAVIDGRPIPLAAPGQFFRVDPEWLGQANIPAGGS